MVVGVCSNSDTNIRFNGNVVRKLMELEKILSKTVISFTDKIFVHPDKYPDYYKWYFPRVHQRTLYVACRHRSYTRIMENVYNALMKINITFHQIPQKDRKRLYQLYQNNKERINYLQEDRTW